MRIVHNPQLVFGQVPIEELPLDSRSRDDIPALLKGIQQLFGNAPLRTQVFDLLERHLLHDASAEPSAPPAARPDPGRGRPGMELWAVLVLALLKQGLKCDFDRLTELANKHSDVRCLLGLSEFDSAQYFSHRSVVRNVSLLTPELLQELNQLVVREGLQLVGVSEEQPVKARVDSFMVETNVQYPTDTALAVGAQHFAFRRELPQHVELIVDCLDVALGINAKTVGDTEHSPAPSIGAFPGSVVSQHRRLPTMQHVELPGRSDSDCPDSIQVNVVGDLDEAL